MKPFESEKLPHSILPVLRILAVSGMAVIMFGCSPPEQADNTPAPKIAGDQITFPTNSPQLGVITTELAQIHNPEAISLFGRLTWNDALTVRVFSPVAGRITKIPVELNQPIAAGEALAEIDSPDFGQARADVRTAAGNFAAAAKAFTRAQDMFAHGAGAQKDVEAAEAAEVAARAEQDRAVARLANYGANLESTNALYLLRSPLAGVLVEKSVTPGQEIRSDAMLANAPQFFSPQFVVTDPTRLWVQLDVPESDLRQLKRGYPLVIRSQSLPDDQFTGAIDAISESLDATTHTVTVHGIVDNSSRKLKAEMFVTVELPNESAARLQVPAKAVYLRGEAHFVFVEESPGTFRRREVKLGETSDDNLEVVDGLKSGERVVVDGALLLEKMFE